MAKAESIKSVSHSGTAYPKCLQAASIPSIFLLYTLFLPSRKSADKSACVYVCVCLRLLGEKSTNNKIMRSSKYSSRWPEQGGVLIEMILGRARLRSFTQIHTQVLSACNIMAPSVRCVMGLLLQTAFKRIK